MIVLSRARWRARSSRVSDFDRKSGDRQRQRFCSAQPFYQIGIDLPNPEGTMTRELNIRRVVVAAILAIVAGAASYGRPQAQGVRFRAAVELVNVTATVTDDSGRFVPGLKQSDFLVYDDEQRVEVTHFSAERVPVSLGIVLDTSGSIAW